MKFNPLGGLLAGLLVLASGSLACSSRTYLIDPEEYMRARPTLTEGRRVAVQAEDEHGAGVLIELGPDDELEAELPRRDDGSAPPLGTARLRLVHENPGPIFLSVGAAVLFTGLAIGPIMTGGFNFSIPVGGPIYYMTQVDDPCTGDNDDCPVGLRKPIGALLGYILALQVSGLGLMIAGIALWDADPEVQGGDEAGSPDPSISFAPVLSLDGQVGGLLQVRF